MGEFPDTGNIAWESLLNAMTTQDTTYLEKLHAWLDEMGAPKHGRFRWLADKTGWPYSSCRRRLQGKEELAVGQLLEIVQVVMERRDGSAARVAAWIAYGVPGSLEVAQAFRSLEHAYLAVWGAAIRARAWEQLGEFGAAQIAHLLLDKAADQPIDSKMADVLVKAYLAGQR